MKLHNCREKHSLGNVTIQPLKGLGSFQIEWGTRNKGKQV